MARAGDNRERRGRRLRPAGCLVLLALAGCNINPPHYVGDEAERQASHSRRPSWLDEPFVLSGGFVFVVGLASRIPTREDARKAAEADARDRLASAIESQIESELEQEERSRGTLAQGRVTSAETTVDVRRRLRSLAGTVVQGMTPVDEYYEEYQLFGEGWQRRFDYWVLLKVPEQEYRGRLEEVRRRSAGPGR